MDHLKTQNYNIKLYHNPYNKSPTHPFNPTILLLSSVFHVKFSNIERRFLILLIYDITNPNSKSENYACIQTSARDVNTDNASSCPRENVTLTNFGVAKIWWEKYGTKIWDGVEIGEAPLGGTYFLQGRNLCQMLDGEGEG